MNCPICNQKAANCGCTATERAQHSSLKDALYEIALLRAEIDRLREERRWIPVEENLPENIQIIATDGEEVSATSYYKGYGFESMNLDKLWFRPTHWQRLPPPPSKKT